MDYIGSKEKIEPAVIRFSIETMIKLLYPMVPHFCAELWEMTGNKNLLDESTWPEFDLETTKEEKLTIVIQIKGKVRSRLEVAPGTDDETLKEMALADANVKKFVGDNSIRKIIVVKNKLLNIVI